MNINIAGGQSEYSRAFAQKKPLARLKIPYIQTRTASSGPKITYLQTGIWPFSGLKIPYFPDRDMGELPGA